MPNKYYELNVAGCKRKLPIMPISEDIAIAGFIILGDTEIVEKSASELAKRIPKETEILMTAETKGIPLVAEMARVLGMKRYIVARKSIKLYMRNPLVVEDQSITTKGKQILCLMDTDAEFLKGKNVLLVDDVISTGGSMTAMKKLAYAAGATVVGEAAILVEGDSVKRKDIIFLEELPLIKLK